MINEHNVEKVIRKLKKKQDKHEHIQYDAEIGTDIFDFYEDEEPYKEMQKW